MSVKKLSNRRGDTLIEVMFSITVFALIAVISVNLMNGGIYTAQKSLEVGMARNEIDAQAEALRYIQHSYLAEKELESGNRQFTALWDRLTDPAHRIAQVPSDTLAESFNSMNRCSEAYQSDGQVFRYGAFVLNTRLIQPDSGATVPGSGMTYNQLLEHMIVGARYGATTNKLQQTSLFPRILYSRWGSSSVVDADSSDSALKEAEMYREIASAQGIWIIAVRGGTNAEDTALEPEFYDFYIRTCWHSIGRSVPSTIGSIVRLYNPEVID
jgi:prepilin-type N-terminal cleavage/methylation domain-containing protein